jgi:hypothetical protein
VPNTTVNLTICNNNIYILFGQERQKETEYKRRYFALLYSAGSEAFIGFKIKVRHSFYL